MTSPGKSEGINGTLRWPWLDLGLHSNRLILMTSPALVAQWRPMLSCLICSCRCPMLGLICSCRCPMLCLICSCRFPHPSPHTTHCRWRRRRQWQWHAGLHRDSGPNLPPKLQPCRWMPGRALLHLPWRHKAMWPMSMAHGCHVHSPWQPLLCRWRSWWPRTWRRLGYHGYGHARRRARSRYRSRRAGDWTRAPVGPGYLDIKWLPRSGHGSELCLIGLKILCLRLGLEISGLPLVSKESRQELLPCSCSWQL